MSRSEPYDIAVEPDGSIVVPADKVAGMSLHPGDHLRLVRDEAPGRGRLVAAYAAWGSARSH